MAKGRAAVRLPMDLCPVTYSMCFRNTHSDVMTVSNTTSVTVVKVRGPNGKKVLPPKFPGGVKRPMPNLMSKRSVRKHNMLVREQVEFMQHLHRERVERLEYETWAATTMQAAVRGHMARPKHRREENRAKLVETHKAAKEGEKKDKQAMTEDVQQLVRHARKTFASDSDSDEDVRDLAHNAWRLEASKAQKRKTRRQKKAGARKGAAMKAQAMCRGFLVRRAVRVLSTFAFDEEMANAAQVIQTRAKSFHMKKRIKLKRLKDKNKYALAIQRVFRGYRERRFVLMVRDLFYHQLRIHRAAVMLQCHIRIYISRRHVGEIRREFSATSIQSAYRGHATRYKDWQAKEEVRREDAAQLLQARGRGFLARKKVNAIKQAKQLESDNAAATRIQAITRGRADRKRAAVVAQGRNESRAATRIQSAQRGKLARTEVAAKRKDKRDNLAATKIQSVQRGNQGRARSQVKKQEAEAATKIATVARGKQAREQVKMKKSPEAQDAATNVQKVVRGRQGRARTNRRRSELESRAENKAKDAAATKVQAMARGKTSRDNSQYIKRKRKKEQDLAATKVQAMARGNMAKKEVQQVREGRKKELESKQPASRRKVKRKTTTTRRR